ncbi:MAG: ribonuclease III [Clostridia bacterium]|nr:ribonuclease III [Clostridia bacterium]
MCDLKQLQKNINYSFQDEALLRHALAHSSYANEHRAEIPGSNERLEFLGDSVLSLITAEYLFEHYKHLPEGKLTKIRAQLVCEGSLFEFAQKFDLGAFLLLGHGEERSGSRNRPSIVSDAFEALLAAIYLDGGLESAKKFVLPFLIQGAVAIEENSHSYDYKTTLQEIAQQNPGELIHYELISANGPDHAKTFEVHCYLNSNLLGTGTGKSKKEAEQMAAKEALKLMGEDQY